MTPDKKAPAKKGKKKAGKPVSVVTVKLQPEDADLAQVAREKLADGQKPTCEERAALKRVSKAADEELRWSHYESVSKGHYSILSGRSVKVLNEQAARHGIPLRGSTIRLSEVLTWFHDYLSEKRYEIRSAKRVAGDLASGDPLLDAGPGALSSPNLEKYRGEKALLARLERLEREGSLLKRDRVRDALGSLAQILRMAMDTLQRACGEEARSILEEALTEFECHLEDFFREEEDLYGFDSSD